MGWCGWVERMARLGRGNGGRRQVVVGWKCVVFPLCIGVSVAKLLAGFIGQVNEAFRGVAFSVPLSYK